MGLFSKIKNILFEDDDEVEDMPVYTKEEVKETAKQEEEPKVEVEVEEPINTSDFAHFRNVKRDIDLSYDEKDVLGEIPGAADVEMPVKKVEQPEVEKHIEEKKSPFLSFDEDEFERLNSRVIKNENKFKKENSNNTNPSNIARKANNNFSSTSTNKDTRIENNERYKINSGTLGNGKKPFTPSPVISPVYGILDKNYRKDDIVDKQGGLKREKSTKPIVHHEEKEKIVEKEVAKEKVYEVDIDSVRKKAYGTLEDMERNLVNNDIPELKDSDTTDKKMEVKEEKAEKIEKVSKPIEEPKKNEVSIEDQLDEKFESVDTETNNIDTEVDRDTELDEVVDKVIEEKKHTDKDDTKSKPQLLDDLEKTSTLQILDDIEKELNSIKPISKDSSTKEDEEKAKIENDDTLENDLFNLIDSMYEEGEEENNDD